MTISCPMDGVEWGGAGMDEALDELAALGVSWIAIHPYAGIRKDGSVPEWRRLALDPEPDWIRRPIEQAHKRGLKVMVKPHLGYWGSGFAWRGDITFQTEAQWARFFTEYTRWIVRVAAVSQGADAFVVGTELDKTLHREADWRAVIGAVRGAWKGPLTYAANWPDYQRVPFWDALDIIGVQAYFPLLAQGAPVSAPALRAGWRAHLDALDAYSRRLGKHVVFTELGYTESAEAAVRPWDDAHIGPAGERVQLTALQVALDEVARHDRIVGAFLWKWFPAGWTPENFNMQAPAVKDLIAREWRQPPTGFTR